MSSNGSMNVLKERHYLDGENPLAGALMGERSTKLPWYYSLLNSLI
jgi:hypothetical protein